MLRNASVIMFLGVINFVQSANMSILKYNKKLYCMVTNDTTNTAIAWDSKYTGASFRYVNITKIPNWEFSTEFASVPILDYRWELIPRETKCHYKLPFGDFIMSVSIQGTSNVYLCETVDKENCYNILLSENGPSRSNNVVRLLCNDFNSTPKNSEWLHFTLSRKNHRLHVKQHGKNNIIELKDLYAPKYLAINGKWKIHTSNLHTPKWSNGPSRTVLQPDIKPNKIICFGLLVYVPKYSLMKLSLYNKNKLVSEQTNTKTEELEEVKLCGYISTTELTLKIDTPPPYYRTSQLYIAEVVRISKLPDIRITTLKQEKENENYCCYDIKSSKKLCTQDLASYNPPGILDCNFTSVGANCIPCTRIFSEAYCTNVSICDYTSSYGVSCSCSSGYRYTGCTEKCPYKYYGFDCKQYCNRCQGSCDHVTGICNSCNGGSNNCLTESAAVHTTTINETSVSISWGLSNVEVDSVQYKIIYWHRNYRACSTNELVQHSDKKEITVDKNSVLLTELLPYSNYTVEITALNDSANPQQINISTADAAMLSENDIPQIYTLQNASQLELRLEINGCSKVTGSISYIIGILCNSAWCQEKDNVFQNITDSWNITINVPVLGHTNYTIKVRVHRNVSFKDIEMSILTGPTAPTAVRDLTAYNVTSTSIGIRWLKPYPPTGLLAEYAVWWAPAYIWRNFSSEAHYCKIWREYICAEFDALASNQKYSFQISAKNKNYDEDGPYEGISVITQNKSPSAPENITYFWKDINNTLVLKWKHPNNPNGFIKEFYAYKSIQYIKTFLVTEERLEYTYELKYNELNTTSSSNLEIGIFANNGVKSSDGTRSTIPTPPKTPIFVSNASAFNITSTSTRIQIPKVLYLDGESSFLFVIVIDKEAHSEKHLNVNDKEIIGRAVGIDEEVKFRIAVNHSLNLSSYGMDEFDVGNELLQNLDAGTTYEIYLLVKNEYKNISRYAVLKLTVTTLPGYNYMPFLLILIIPVVCIFVFIFYKRKRTKLKSSSDILLTTIAAEHVYEEIAESKTESSEYDIMTKHSDRANKSFQLVKVSDLEEYVKIGLESKELEKQYEAIPMGQTKDWNYGLKKENKSKNRYKNVVAYDYTRVKLSIVGGDPCSDYINANYIDGYNNKRAYIATQGPKSNTINDFWRMVWQEKVEYIVMIANITEGGKVKVDKYWPDINGTQAYGDITVTYSEIVIFPEYEIKVLVVKHRKEERQVTHLHFTCWPDHGVPFYPQSLAPFLKRAIKISQNKAPTIVHCSAGVGRTGTFILSDICLRMAAKTGKVDVYDNLTRLREQRINMVDNINQYKLVHLVLLHVLVAPDYTIECTETMDKDVNEVLSSSMISEQMQYVTDTFWQDEAMKNVSDQVIGPINQSKNRFENILPDNYSRITLQLYPTSDDTSTYINAVKVDGFCSPSKFIVTQYPLNNTVGDFWRLVDEYEIFVLICLNKLDLQDKTCCKFYPSLDETMQPTPYLEIKCIDVKKETCYKIHTISMHNTHKNETRTVKVVHVNDWMYDAAHPKTPTDLLLAYEEVYYLGRASRKILISCLDGCRASGLFTAVCCLIDKIKMEQICDVCLAVRTVRHGRIDFVKDMQQFSFLYKCGLEYVQQFEMYSNFLKSK